MCPLSSHQDANQNIKLNKNQNYPKIMYEVSENPLRRLHSPLPDRPNLTKGFSEALAAKIEVPQIGSTRLVYETKWNIFAKCCHSSQVNFRSPPIKSVEDFLMYIF